MKNLLSFTNPSGEFTDEDKTLVKIHIDNSLDLGWKKDDILLFTNFPYEYNGVKALPVPAFDIKWDRTSNKIPVIEYLLLEGMFPDLYWYHDFDAYQNEPFDEAELSGFDLGLTTYGYKDQINGGSFFFRENTHDFFDYLLNRLIPTYRTRADEKTMTDMWREGTLNNWNHKILNITYNFGQRGPSRCYKQADKPLKVLHFHPYYQFYPHDDTNINVFMHGHNQWGIPMMSQRLIDVFKHHGVQ
jgi:hypothetical protein